MTTFLLVLALQFVGAQSTEAAEESGHAPAPAGVVSTLLSDAQLAKLTGTDGKAAELGSDKKKLIYFWATWCPTCRQKLQNGDLAALHSAPGVDVIAVNTDKEAERAASYVAKHKPAVTVARDPAKAVTEPLQAAVVPYWAVVERDEAAKGWKVTAAAEGGDLVKIRAALGL